MHTCDKEYTLSFIGQLLHPKISAANLYHYFPAKQKFWDCLVQIGSEHLVLPAIYGALKRKKLEPHTPRDLWSYLEKISELNHKRNTNISKQIISLSEIFNKHQIEHVFLKGAAMIVTKHYDAMYERMVGDIDILVAENDLIKAQKILFSFGYIDQSEVEKKLRPVVIGDLNRRHLNRLKHLNFIASVELHLSITNHNKYYFLPSKEVLKARQQTKEGFWIPSLDHLWQHAILNSQYNDKGYQFNWLILRTVVDVLYLEPKNIITVVNKQPKVIQHFYSMMSFFYLEYSVFDSKHKALFIKHIRRNSTIQKMRIFNDRLIMLSAKIFNRSVLFFKSKGYRRNIFQNPKFLIRQIIKSWKP